MVNKVVTWLLVMISILGLITLSYFSYQTYKDFNTMKIWKKTHQYELSKLEPQFLHLSDNQIKSIFDKQILLEEYYKDGDIVKRLTKEDEMALRDFLNNTYLKDSEIEKNIITLLELNIMKTSAEELLSKDISLVSYNKWVDKNNANLIKYKDKNSVKKLHNEMLKISKLKPSIEQLYELDVLNEKGEVKNVKLEDVVYILALTSGLENIKEISEMKALYQKVPPILKNHQNLDAKKYEYEHDLRLKDGFPNYLKNHINLKSYVGKDISKFPMSYRETKVYNGAKEGTILNQSVIGIVDKNARIDLTVSAGKEPVPKVEVKKEEISEEKEEVQEEPSSEKTSEEIKSKQEDTTLLEEYLVPTNR